VEVNVQIYCGNGRIAINLGDVVIAVELKHFDDFSHKNCF